MADNKNFSYFTEYYGLDETLNEPRREPRSRNEDTPNREQGRKKKTEEENRKKEKNEKRRGSIDRESNYLDETLNEINNRRSPRNRGNDTPNREEGRKKKTDKENRKRNEDRRENRREHTNRGNNRVREYRDKKKTKEIKIMYMNINGINSKKESLQTILKEEQPHLIAIAETKTIHNPKIENYVWITKFKPNKAGGVTIGARQDIANKTTEVRIDRDTDQKMEISWISLKTNKKPLYLGVFYGKQESENREIVEREYSEMTTQVLKLEKTGNVILAGDYNAKLKVKKDGEIIQKQSPNGKLLQRMIKMTDMTAISLNTTQGTWTRQNRHNEKEKSIIDYMICSKNMVEQIINTEIDEEGIIRPKGTNETDHNTILTRINMQIQKHTQKITKWTINEKTDWKRYNEIIKQKPNIEAYDQLENRIIEALNIVAKKKTVTINNKQRLDEKSKIAKQDAKIAKKRFEKECKEQGAKKTEYYNIYIGKRKILRDSVEQAQKKRVSEMANKLIKDGGVKSAYFWKLRKNILKRQEDQYDFITEEGHKITEPESVKEKIAEYYEDLYQARQSEPEYQEWSNKIEKEYQQRQIREPKTPQKQITKKEIDQALNKLKPRKATGPDDIPNEAIKQLDKKNRIKLTQIFNHILEKNEIPNKWQESSIIRIYKGKGQKGKCSAERGITLSSNMGKVFERIIDTRTKEQINITDEQAGGRKNRATTDHIAILNDIIQENKKRKKPTYITYLDVKKAYDKAWIKAIMYVMAKEGLDDRNWKIVDNLNKDLTARIQTKYGPTRPIKIRDSIRQGGVLSVIQYALLMNEISKENEKIETGTQIPNTQKRINTLLWMDDVVLITDNRQDMEKLLKSTNEIANRYHIAFSKEKSNLMKIDSKKKEQEKEEIMKIGNITLEETEKYKYLGVHINKKANLKEQIDEIKTKTEAAYQTILHILYNGNFCNIQMQVIWKLVETCIIPIITYATETYQPTKSETKTLNTILDNILKRILKVPTGTPREALYLETNLIDIEKIIEKKKLNMYYRINKTPNEMTKYLFQEDRPTIWLQDIKKVATKNGINLNELLQMKMNKAKRKIRKTLQAQFRKEIRANQRNKTKIAYLIDGYNEEEKPTYTNKLNREETSILFKARTRMTEFKGNYKNKHNDMTCRLCGEADETQEHVLNECPTTREKNLHIPKEILFATGTYIQKRTIKKLREIDKMIEKNQVDN